MINVSIVSELNKSVKERAYQVTFRGNYNVFKGGDIKSVKKECEGS